MSNYRTQYEIYYSEALARLNSGQSPDEIFAFASGIDDVDYREGTLAKLALHFASKGQVEQAMIFSRAIENPLEYADALFDIGRELGRANSPSLAKKVLRLTIEAAEKLDPDAWEIPAILLQVSDELWSLGEKEDAVNLLHVSIEKAKRHPQQFEASKTLAGCVRLLSRWGYSSEALKVAEAIGSAEQRNRVLEEIQGLGPQRTS